MLRNFFLRSPLVELLPKRFYARKNFQPSTLHGKLGVIGVPFGKGQKGKGKDEVGLKIAPDLIRKKGFIEDLRHIGVDIEDYGNVEYEPQSDFCVHNMHNFDHFAPCAKSVSESVECILEEGRGCLVLGGDQSVCVGSIHGHLKVADPRKVALLYIDAHTDINTSRTSASGCINGMTVSLIAKEMQSIWEEAELPGMDWMTACLSLKNIAYIATRSVECGEVKVLNEYNIATFGVEDIDRIGIHKVLRSALERVDPAANRSLHVSFDIDALDPLEAPCTTAPVRGGMTLREALSVAECLHKTQRVSVMDLAEVNAASGNEIQRQTTLDAANHILLSMFGHKRKGNLIKKEDSNEEKAN